MKTFVIILSILGLCLNAYSQRAYSDEQWIEDLEFMVHRIDSIHPGPYKYMSKEEFILSCEALKSGIPNMTDSEIKVELFRLISKIRDGHTRLHGSRISDVWYPIRLEEFSDGVFLTAAGADYSAYIGAQVTEINMRDIKDVFQIIGEIVPHDNKYSQMYFIPMFLTMSSIMEGLHLSDSAGRLPLTLVDRDGIRSIKTIDPAEFQQGEDLGWFWHDYGVPSAAYMNIIDSIRTLPLYLQNYDMPFWFTHLKEQNAVYFGFNECSGDAGFEAFNRKLWNYIDSCKAENLIVDLRNNFGGTNDILMPFVHDLIRHEDIGSKDHLYVITGPKTFSAALHCASLLEKHSNPIFVGQPTGAGPNHYADPDFSIFPNCGMLLMVSKYYWQNSYPWDQREYIEPQLDVNLTSGDYFGYRDPAMEAILWSLTQAGKIP